MSKENLYDKLRLECHHKSYDCSSMRYIFEKRAERLKWRVTLIKAFGIIVPATVGITVLGYGIEIAFLKNIIIVAILVSCFQFVISLWAIIYNWDGELAYSYEAIQSYNSLYTQYHNLANYPPDSFEELKPQFDLVSREMAFRSQQDASHNVRQWENRMGMRYSLREHQAKCVGCNVIPLSLESTDCDVCGKFAFKFKYFKNQ